MNKIKPEYPRPQFERKSYINLNGEWEFEIDNSFSEKEKGICDRHLKDKIIVPFCPESKLSGIENKDYMNKVWYRKDFTAKCDGKRLILHFGAVDWEAELFINGTYVATHRGGYTPFDCDITDYVKDGENYITLSAYDNAKDKRYGSGKQCWDLRSRSCLYTRTTGIWQTVWYEYVDPVNIKEIKMYPSISDTSVMIEAELSDYCGTRFNAEVYFDNNLCGKASIAPCSNRVRVQIPLSEEHLWELGNGNLYDVKLTLTKDNAIKDEVKSYFGLREVALRGNKFYLNGKSVFQRLVLDQGFYPDGIYTSKNDDEIKADILSSLKYGFNGARLHEKVFEPRYLYWADKLGYMVWGETPDWGMDLTNYKGLHYFINEWLEEIKRDFNHPSIIGWCPFNEVQLNRDDDIIPDVYKITKQLDNTRPVIDVSGFFHTSETDIVDAHIYEENPDVLKSMLTEPGLTSEPDDTKCPEQDWKKIFKKGKPLFISEYGGIGFSSNDNDVFYGAMPKTREEFVKRYKGVTEAMLFNENVMGFCYTQLYDVEQETNGLMTYQREDKFPPEIFYKINTQIAEVEKE